MLRLYVVLLFFVSLNRAQAFVENVSHGYPACIACHISPSGGGVTTDYGRSLSKELMSTWGGPWEGFEKPFLGLAKNTKHIKLGGDVRIIDTTFENDTVKSGQQFTMQNNLELALLYKSLSVVGTLGTREGPDRTPDKNEFLSERYYLVYNTAPTERLRLGKFRSSFGLNIPNHTRYIKSLFDFGSNSETHNIEFTKIFENYDYTVGLNWGNLENPSESRSESAVLNFSHYINGKSRVGGSLLLGQSDVESRYLMGLHAVQPLSDHVQVLSEFVYENSKEKVNSSKTDLIASYLKLSYRIFKGFQSYLLFEHNSNDPENSKYEVNYAPGVGVQWLPLPHVNLQVEYTQARSKKDPGNPSNIYWVLLHIYN